MFDADEVYSILQTAACCAAAIVVSLIFLAAFVGYYIGAS